MHDGNDSQRLLCSIYCDIAPIRLRHWLIEFHLVPGPAVSGQDSANVQADRRRQRRCHSADGDRRPIQRLVIPRMANSAVC